MGGGEETSWPLRVCWMATCRLIVTYPPIPPLLRATSRTWRQNVEGIRSSVFDSSSRLPISCDRVAMNIPGAV
jgi:hypothetical protein